MGVVRDEAQNKSIRVNATEELLTYECFPETKERVMAA